MDICLRDLFQAHEENQLKLSYTSKSRGVIGPGSSQEIPVILLAKATGKWHHTLHIAVFGSVLPPLVSVCLCVFVCVVLSTKVFILLVVRNMTVCV